MCLNDPVGEDELFNTVFGVFFGSMIVVFVIALVSMVI
jgi:hypothetical protein